MRKDLLSGSACSPSPPYYAGRPLPSRSARSPTRSARSGLPIVLAVCLALCDRADRCALLADRGRDTAGAAAEETRTSRTNRRCSARSGFLVFGAAYFRRPLLGYVPRPLSSAPAVALYEGARRAGAAVVAIGGARSSGCSSSCSSACPARRPLF